MSRASGTIGHLRREHPDDAGAAAEMAALTALIVAGDVVPSNVESADSPPTVSIWSIVAERRRRAEHEAEQRRILEARRRIEQEYAEGVRTRRALPDLRMAR